MNVLICSILSVVCLSFHFCLHGIFIECLNVFSKNFKNSSIIVFLKKGEYFTDKSDWIQEQSKLRLQKNVSHVNIFTLIEYRKRERERERKRKRKKANSFYVKPNVFFNETKTNKNKNTCRYRMFKLYNEKKNKDLYLQNLKTVKKIDNSILGKCLEGKEEELIDAVPDKFINSLKWALEFRIKNMNCKYMRIQKLAKKNNESLKSIDNYAIGYQEQLLSMLLKDKTYFVSIVKKLKSSDYFNFDIYSIFRFINIDIRFLFNPDCVDHSALFYLLFGNLHKVLQYYHEKSQLQNISIEKESTPTPIESTNRDEEKCEKLRGNRKVEQKKSEQGEEQTGEQCEVDKEEQLEEKREKKLEEGHETRKETQVEIKTETDKLDYFLENYDKIEEFFKKSFQNADEMKRFFEEMSEDNNLDKKEINFSLDDEEIVKIKKINKNGLNLEMIKSIITRSPRLAIVNKKTFLKRVSHYKNELNYTYEELIKILFNLPQFYAFGNLKRKFKELLYLDETIEEEDLKMLIKIYPRIFTYNIYRTIRPKVLYLIRHMNKTFKDVLSFPQYFSYSFRLRIIPRHVAFMNIYYPNYIAFYKTLVKKYNYAEFNKNFNFIVYKQDIPPINLKMLLKSSDEQFREYFKIPYDDFVTATQLAKNIHNPFIME